MPGGAKRSPILCMHVKERCGGIEKMLERSVYCEASLMNWPIFTTIPLNALTSVSSYTPWLSSDRRP